MVMLKSIDDAWPLTAFFVCISSCLQLPASCPPVGIAYRCEKIIHFQKTCSRFSINWVIPQSRLVGTARRAVRWRFLPGRSPRRGDPSCRRPAVIDPLLNWTCAKSTNGTRSPALPIFQTGAQSPATVCNKIGSEPLTAVLEVLLRIDVQYQFY